MTNQEILNVLILSDDFNNFKKTYSQIGCDVTFSSYNNVSLNGNYLRFDLELNWVCKETGEKGSDNDIIQILIGHKTKSGYLSTKKLGLDIKDSQDLSFEEVVSALSLMTDAINKKFDPFFHENNINSKNASAWSYIALNHLQDDCR